jgi:hypothetical protein
MRGATPAARGGSSQGRQQQQRGGRGSGNSGRQRQPQQPGRGGKFPPLRTTEKGMLTAVGRTQETGLDKSAIMTGLPGEGEVYRTPRLPAGEGCKFVPGFFCCLPSGFSCPA